MAPFDPQAVFPISFDPGTIILAAAAASIAVAVIYLVASFFRRR